MLGALALLAVVVVLWIFWAPIASWLRSVWSFDAIAFLEEHPLAVVLLVGGLCAYMLIWYPKSQAAHPELTPQARVEAKNEARKTSAEIIGGAALLVGLLFTWENLKITQKTTAQNLEIARETLKISQEGQVTERLTKAIDQLGAVNDKGEKQLEIRLGGIYALERLARDSERDYGPIMEILTTYVRVHAPWPPKEAPVAQTIKFDRSAPTPAADIQAILTVLGRRTRTFGKGEDRPLNLVLTDLRGANLRRAHLQGANLWGARLEGAVLRDAHLEGARNLTVAQLCTVHTLYRAQLDPPLLEQVQQQCPQRLEEPRE